MKSLAERLKKREEEKEKERLKRSGRVKSFTVKIPCYGYPSIQTDGDKIYIRKRAEVLLSKIRSNAAWQFCGILKELLTKGDKKEEPKPLENPIAVSEAQPAPSFPATAPVCAEGNSSSDNNLIVHGFSGVIPMDFAITSTSVNDTPRPLRSNNRRRLRIHH